MNKSILDSVALGTSVETMASTVTTADLLHILFDPDCGEQLALPLPPVSATGEYEQQLAAARAKSGSDESVQAWQGEVAGITVVLLMGDFNFLAGSVGSAAAHRIVAAIEYATAAGLPLVCAPISGGTRMQEGTPAFVQMVPIAAALQRHREAGIAAITWLRDPTTGGVMATWGSLGHVTAAEPGALVGFLGPRVYELVTGEVFPPGVQTSENLLACGVIDAVVPATRLKQWLVQVLKVVRLRPGSDADNNPAPGTRSAYSASRSSDAWANVQATRTSGRPGVRELINTCCTNVVPLPGTATGERDDAIFMALASIANQGVVVVGHDRHASSAMGPAGLRMVQRAARLARELRLPLITIIDTEGAQLSVTAEQGALAGEIARTLALLGTIAVPSLSVLLGSGCGGGALALLPADRIVAAADTWITPLPPEGAAAIMYRDTDRAPELARTQHITAADLAQRGIVDVVTPPATQADWLSELGAAIAAELAELAVLTQLPTPARLSRYHNQDQ